MRIPKDLVPQKVVAEDLCVSLVTLWRARQSNILGFPAPTIIRMQIYWKKSELQALEDALMQFRGRSAFERNRDHARRVQALDNGRRPSKRKPRRAPRRNPSQQELF